MEPATELIPGDFFRAVVETTPDTIVVVDERNKIAFVNQKASETFGFPAEEMLRKDFSLFLAFPPEETILPDGLPLPKDKLPADTPKEAVGFRRGGQTFLVEFSASRWDSGGRTHFFYIIRDISLRKKKYQELELLLQTTEAISQAADFDSAIGITIRKVCELTGWEVGEAWIPDRHHETFTYSPQWYAVSESLFPFTQQSARYVFRAGQSLVGRVIQNAVVEWCPDVSSVPEAEFSRLKIAQQNGLRAGLGVPIISDGEVLAALLFFMRESRSEDQSLIRLVSSVAGQLGSVLKRKKVQEQLQESETKYRFIFEKSSDPVLLIADGRFIDCNQATVDMLSAAKKEDVLARKPEDFSPAYQPDGQLSDRKANAMVQKAMEKGWHRFEWMLQRTTGEPFWVEVSLTAIPFEKEQILHTVWHDISARKLAEENLEKEREYLGAVLEKVEDGIVGCDEKGMLSFFNRATRQLHGLPEKPLKPEEWASYYNLFHVDGRTPLAMEEVPLFRAYRGEPVRNVEIVIAPKKGPARHVMCSGRKISSRDGKNLGAVVVMHNITGQRRNEQELHQKNLEISWAYEELKAAEQELIKANNELEERVRKRTEELSAKNRELYSKNLELVSMNNDLDNFVYIASHDLKVPLLNMEALLGILRSELVQDNAESQFVFRKFVAAIKRMKQTIQDVTEVAKAQRKLSERPERVQFTEIVQEVKASVESLITSTGARIIEDFSKAPSLIYSQINLKSIVYNLVSNALLYRSPERPPEIILRTHRQEGYLVLCVQDNGLGINLDRGTDKLFAMFTRLHSHVEGSGIGLYIVNRLVQNQGGKIEVESQVGQGSTFRIFFREVEPES